MTTVDIDIIRGNSLTVQCLVSMADGSSLTITKAWFTVRKRGYTEIIFDYNTEDDASNISIKDNSTPHPIITVQIFPAQSRLLSITDCPYDFQVLLSNGEIHTPSMGSLNVVRNVTEEYRLNADIPPAP